MGKFFISYNRADRDWAEWIAWQLEDAGYNTVLQAWDFRPGDNFILKMDEATFQAERTIVVLSPDYLESDFVKPEWAAALAKNPTSNERKLVPVRVRDLRLEGLLSPIVYIDLVDTDETTAKTRLLEGVHQGRAKPTIPPPFPLEPKVSSNSEPKPPFPGISDFPSKKSPKQQHPKNGNSIFLRIVGLLFALLLLAVGFFYWVVVTPTSDPSKELADISSIARARIDTISYYNGQVERLNQDYVNAPITDTMTQNGLVDLNNALTNLWSAIAGYGLGGIPYSQSIRIADTGSVITPTSLPTSLISIYHRNYDSYGIGELYERTMEIRGTSKSTYQSEYESLISPYDNPSSYPFVYYYRATQDCYSKGQVCNEAEYSQVMSCIYDFALRLKSRLIKLKTVFPITVGGTPTSTSPSTDEPIPMRTPCAGVP